MKRLILAIVFPLMLGLGTGCIHVYHHGEGRGRDCRKSDCSKKSYCDKVKDCGDCPDKSKCDKKKDCQKKVCPACKDGKKCPKCAAKFRDGASEEPFKRATTEELSQWIAKGDTTLIDNNRPEMYADGHIPGAKHLGWDAVSESDLPADKSTRLVFYCANLNCGACHKAAEKAIELGYDNVWIYALGIEGWKDAGKKVEK